MEYRKQLLYVLGFELIELQTEQRNELTRLLKKYGQSWEPWRTELARFKNEGKDLTKSDA